MTDEEVIKRRLLIDGDGTGDDRRLNNLMKSIIKWSNTAGLSDAENDGMMDRLLTQVAQCEFPAERIAILEKTNDQQLEDYKNMQEEIEENIASVKQKILENKNKLAEAQKLKENKMSYDLLAKSIEEQPTREVTEKKLSSLRQELENFKEERRSFDDLLEQRKKQFYVLSSSANQIKKLLDAKKTDEAVNTSLDDVTISPGPEPMSE